MQNLASAKAQKDLQELRMERQSQLASLSGIRGQSTGLERFDKARRESGERGSRYAHRCRYRAEALDQAAEIDAIRRSVTSNAANSESTLQRLQRLSGQVKSEVAA